MENTIENEYRKAHRKSALRRRPRMGLVPNAPWTAPAIGRVLRKVRKQAL